MAEPTTRAYRSPRRALQAAQTRTAVLRAARELFAEKGWAATGMRDVARAAQVSVETIYGTLGGKVGLLTAALDGAVVGDDEPVPLAERPLFRALGEGDLAARAAAGAALITDIHVRTIGLHLALREGAGSEPALAELRTTQEQGRRGSTADGLRLVLGRPVDDREVDLFWAQTCPEVYELLVHRSGWSVEQYQQWVLTLITELENGS
ncbi:TetR/AcrR family transcriptional regulator [Actinomycetospora aeridis]|uniref:Helix-turn-helix domain-containing protein n=1 Tax=Actinomycetospora aeridis TaxID=3129231 RepID=A0ABU8ND12_9PSEU